LKVLSQSLSNIENSLGKLQVSSVDMAADISHLRRAVNDAQAKSQSTSRQSQLTDLNFPTLALVNVQSQAQA
jgi:tRNA A-37 threonylcarbamoyl transferase component Bud32